MVPLMVTVWLRLPRALIVAPIGVAIWMTSLARVALHCARLQRDGRVPSAADGLLTLELPREIRGSFTAAFIGAAIFAVGMLLAVIVVWTRAPASPDRALAMGLSAALAAAAVAWLVLTFRGMRVRFDADARGLRWSGPLRSSVELPWDRIARLEPRGPRRLPLRFVAVMTDGRVRRVTALDPTIPFSAEGARALLTELGSLRPGTGDAP